MPKQDPRTQRGLAVARRMQQVGLTPGRKDSTGEALSRAARAMSEAERQRRIAEIVARLTPADRAALEASGREYARINWLKERGALPRDMDVLTAYDHVRASEPLMRQQQAVQQAYANADAELVNFARQLTPNHVNEITAQFQAGGWPAVRALVAPYLSQTAQEVLTSSMVECGGDLNALAQRVAQRVQRDDANAVEAQASQKALAERVEGMASLTQAAIEKWTPREGDAPGLAKLKDSSPIAKLLRDPKFHVSAQDWIEPRAEQLRAQGLLKDGVSPGEAFLTIARSVVANGGPAGVANGHRPHAFAAEWADSDAYAALAAVVGENPQAVRAFFSQMDGAETTHRVMATAAKGMDEERARRARVAQNLDGKDGRPLAVEPVKARRDGLDAAAEKAARAHGIDGEEPYLARSALEAAVMHTHGHRVDFTRDAKRQADRILARDQAPAEDRGIDAAMRKASAHLEASTPAAPIASRAEGEGASIDEAISRAHDHLNGGSTDAE